MQVLIRYTVKREEVPAHLELVGAVYAELHRLAPAGLGYATYQLEDGASFVEVLTGPAGPGPLAASAAFQRFRSTLDARCEHPAVPTELREVGSYTAATLSTGQGSA